jgi:hypothetical protein
MRVILEVGKKRRVVAGALDWPGLDRWGTSEEDALAKLSAYVPRYAAVAVRAGRGGELGAEDEMEVIERVPGSSSTDYFGIAHVPSDTEREVLASADLERRLDLLRACWAHFDEVAASTTGELVLGPRGGGWTRDELVRHVHVNEPEQFSRKVEVRTPRDEVMTSTGLAAHRDAYVEQIRAYNAEGKAARTWPIQFLIRRTAHHVMDHAWEIEDRDPGR